MDVPMTAVQEKIWELLPENCKAGYAKQKNSTSIMLIQHTAEFPLLTHTFRGGNKLTNMIEDITGTVTMRDLGCFERALQQEQGTFEPRRDAVLYGLGYFISSQMPFGQEKTLVFPLNMCSIDEHVNPGMTVKTAFYNWWRNMSPYDVFEKKYLVFPVIFNLERYCTIVLNPIGAVKKAKKVEQVPGIKVEQVPEPEPVMVHFGTGRMTEYMTDVVPRIMNVLGYFMERYSVEKSYYEFLKDKFAHRHIVPSPMEKQHKDFQMMLILKTMLKLVVGNITDEQLMEKLQEIGSNEDLMATGVAAVRTSLLIEVHDIVNEDPLSPAAHLFQQRRLVLAEEKKYLEQFAEQRKRKAEQDADNHDGNDDQDKKPKWSVKKEEVEEEMKEEVKEEVKEELLE